MYLMFFIVIVPSVLLTSLDVWIEKEVSLPTENMWYLLSNMFLAESGSFFVNYMITATLMGNLFELLRVTDLVKARWYSFRAVTYREILEAHERSASPFAYSVQYSWNLVIFAIVLMFGCFIPLILPFGFVHFGVKYIVDKYNLVYVCPKLYESDGQILNTGLNYVIFCIILCQVVLGGFFAIKGQLLQGLVVLVVSIASISLFSYYSFRKQKFRKKQMHRIESVVKNREEQCLQLGEEDDQTNYLQAYKGAYLHPALHDDEENNLSSTEPK